MLGNKAFEELEKQIGITYNKDGVLAEARLCGLISISGTTYDAMHTYFQSGVANVETHLLLKQLQSRGITWEALSDFMKANIKWPSYQQAKNNSLHQCFNEARKKGSKKTFKAGASEMMSVVPVLNHFLDLLPSDVKAALKYELASYHLMAKCVRCYMDAKRGDDVEQVHEFARKWATTESKHQEAFIKAYGVGRILPKHHFRHHLPEQYRRDAMVLDCFPLERSYHTSKQIAAAIKNTRQFERTLLTRTLAQTIRDLENNLEPDGLKGEVSTDAALSRALGCDENDVQFALRMDCKGGVHLASGDAPSCRRFSSA